MRMLKVIGGSRARLRITLTARRTGHFTQAGVALTNTAESIIAHTHTHTPWKKRKQIKEKAGTGERSKTERVEKARLEVRIIAKQAIILSSSLAYSMLCIS